MREFRLGLLGLAAVALSATGAAAQGAYPNQPVRIIVPFSAGSITDGLARSIADKLQDSWKQQVIIENRPGLPGTTGVAKAAPDGYTLMLTSNGHTIAGALNKSLQFDPVKDFAGVTQVASVPLVLIIPPELPVKTVKEFVDLAKQKPGTMNFASAGIASTSYLSAELFKQVANIQMQHVPYKGAPEATTSVIRNDSQLYMLGVNLTVELQESGKVRALAMTTPKRVAQLPNVPTMVEAGLTDYKYDAWFAVFAPAGTPKAILDKASKDIAAVLQLADIKERLAKQGVEVVTGTPEQLDALNREDTERYTKILKDAGVQPN